MQRVSRRKFLRLTSLGTAGALIGCATPTSPVSDAVNEAMQTAAAVPTSPPAAATTVATATVASAATAAPVMLALPSSSDVWAWNRTLRGTLPTGAADAHLLVAGSRVDLVTDGDRWQADVPMNEGANEVVLVANVDGAEQRSEAATYTVKLTAGPIARVGIVIENGVVTFDADASEPRDGDAVITTYAWSFRDTNPAPVTVEDAAAPNTTAAVPSVDGEYYVSLRVSDAEGRADTAGSYFVIENGVARVPDFAREGPDWIDRAVVYGVIPNKFGDPGIPAVTEKLDYLRELGVNALWFSPITDSPAGDYGYAVEDYFAVTPRFGTADDFRTLVREAHARDIRVLMDFVPNHSSDTHPYFEDAQARGEASSYYTFYDRDGAGNPTHYFDWENLPNLNYNNAEVERWMIEAFAYWVREFDVDGFRVDVAWGVKERKPEFWPAWRTALKRIKPDLMLLAEASARDSYYFDNGYDVAYDWTAQVGRWAWEIAWESSNLMVYNLNDALTNRDLTPRSRTMHFLNNNDTGSRFITDHGEEMTRTAAALLLTVPGIPCVYTGDEWGAWYSPYYDELPMQWDLEKYPGLHDYYQKLIRLRLDTPSLRSYAWTPLEARPSQPIYTYIRHADDGSDPVLVALNFGDEETTAALELPEEFASMIASGTLRDVLNDEDVPVNSDDGPRIAMPPWKARILVGA